MGLGCGAGVASHNASTTTHANGLTTLANLYVVAGGKMGWSDAYLTRSGAGVMQLGAAGAYLYTGSARIDLAALVVAFGGGDISIAGTAANVLGLGAGDSLYFDHLGAVRILSGAGVPGASVVGDLYYDNTNHDLYVHSSGNWRKVACADAGFA